MNILKELKNELIKKNIKAYDRALEEVENEKANKILKLKKQLLIGKELEILKRLKEELNQNYEIYPKISFNSIIIGNQTNINTIDYLICEKDTQNIKLALILKRKNNEILQKQLINMGIKIWIIDIESNIENQINNLIGNLPPL